MYHSGLRGFVALVTIILVSAGCGNIEVASTTPEGTCESDSDCITDTSCEVGVCNKSKGLCAYTVANGKCLVEGQCYESGDPQPSLPCKVCRPDLDQQSFLNKTCAEGQICEPTNGECVGDSPEKCGNGNKEPGEACDDGNTAPGDGCDAACAVESGWVCETVGAACTDIDECAQGPSPCDVNATCTNSEGAYSCACNEGFTGDGTTCTQADVCAADPARWDDVVRSGGAAKAVTGLGAHPWWAETADVQAVVAELEHRQPAYVGEIGLDRTRGDLQRQWPLFQAQLEWSVGRPVVIHAVRTVDKVLNAVRDVGHDQAMIHAFAGSVQQVERAASLGVTMSIGPLALRASGRMVDAIRAIPSELLVLETDTPDHAHAGVGQPSDLVKVARAVAAVRDADPVALFAATGDIARRLFGPTPSTRAQESSR